MDVARERLSIFIQSLEIPDCGCPTEIVPCGCDGPCLCPTLFGTPCPHIQARNHRLSIDQWADLLSRDDEYREPPLPPVTLPILSQEARVEQYRQRHEKGLALFPKLPMPDLAAGVRVHNGPNGIPFEDGLGLSCQADVDEIFDLDQIAGSGIVAERWRSQRQEASLGNNAQCA